MKILVRRKEYLDIILDQTFRNPYWQLKPTQWEEMETSPLIKMGSFCHRNCVILHKSISLFWDFNLEIYFHRNIIQIMFAKVWSCWNFFHSKKIEKSFSFYWKSHFNQVLKDRNWKCLFYDIGPQPHELSSHFLERKAIMNRW